ncbi:MAG: hypothetical protein BGO14_05915 [Chlamydiales bacterium 38-26]|nr:hypothetical protein [Chlamydiales bacterium]OJV08429.1 MAG: hypothetical protein BGO14_05915 [Chlamydiales bacterium 38-26]
MKTFFILIITAIFLFSLHDLRADLEDKIYIQPHQVSLSNEGIYVQLEEDSIPLEVGLIRHDDKGLFVQARSLASCGHGLGCKQCRGCSVRGCRNQCYCYPCAHQQLP